MDPTKSKPPTRQRRKAAVEADKKIKQTVNLIHIQKPKFRHGWIESDQCFDLDPAISTCLVHDSGIDADINSDFDNSSSSKCPTSDTSSPGCQEHPSASSSDDDMTWDASPEQYALISTQTNEIDAWSSPPFAPPNVNLPPAFPRDRIYAFTQPPLTRRNAFRLPNSNHAFITSPTNDPQTLRKSRIPLPTAPVDVNLHEVNDVSLVLPAPTPSVATRRSTRYRRQPDRFGAPSLQQLRDHGEDRRREEEEEEKEHVSRKR